jgi:ubiquinone/menaquinone biosynthesis C-methylase UbiE
MSFKGGNNKSNVYDSERGYDLYASEYDKSHEFLNSFEGTVPFQMMGEIKGKKILDIGCGTGRITGDLLKRGGEVVAADHSAEMLKLATKKYPAAKTIRADIAKLPFEDDSFDIVVAMFVVVHLVDLREAFDEVYRVLKNGGIFILSNINQKKAPKLELSDGREIVIRSQYHIPKHLLEALEGSFFKIEKEEILAQNDIWINQIVKAVKEC